MKINYIETAKLVDIRMKQIEDASLEYQYFNEEYNNLKQMREQLTKLILLERKDWKDYEQKGKECKK